MATGVEVSPEKIDTDVLGSQDGDSMKPKVPSFSFKERVAEKAVARARDEELLRSGKVSHADMSRANGGFVRGARYIGPSKRIQALVAPKSSDEDEA